MPHDSGHQSKTLTHPVSPKRSAKRAKLFSIENANRVGAQVTDRILSATAVVKTGNPLPPFRNVLASNAPQGRTVSRVVTCNDDEP